MSDVQLIGLDDQNEGTVSAIEIAAGVEDHIVRLVEVPADDSQGA